MSLDCTNCGSGPILDAGRVTVCRTLPLSSRSSLAGSEERRQFESSARRAVTEGRRVLWSAQEGRCTTRRGTGTRGEVRRVLRNLPMGLDCLGET